MMSVTQTAIYNAMKNNAALTTLIGSGKISYKIAPSNAQFPYVVFYEVNERYMNTHKKDELDIWFSVRIMDTSNSVTQAAAELIKGIFHRKSLTVTGWNVYRSQFTTQTVFLEQVERVQVYKQTLDFRLTMNN